MHLLIPFAAPMSEAGRQALGALRLPALEELLGELVPAARDEGDAQSLSPPHERALAREMGLSGSDGTLPWGAREASLAGLETAGQAWGVLTPVHWSVESDGVRLADPMDLALGEAASRALFGAVRPLLEEEGATVAWRAPLVWLIAHPMLDGLACASVDRAVGRAVEPWLPDLGFVRRVQLAVQMLLHAHPVNTEREAQGVPPVNSVWLSGCGQHQAAHGDAGVRVDDRLRGPALAQDWAAWMDAWRALDAGPVAALRGSRGSLTLCGERSAQRFEPSASAWWQRIARGLRRADAAALLEGL
jgi:hypothetical protein